MPLRFVDESGTLVNIYQLLNNVYDQQYMEIKDSVGFFECFKGLLDSGVNDEMYSYITIKAHNDEYFFSKTPLLKMLDYAKEKGIPVLTPLKLLEFIKAKDNATFNNIEWPNNKLSFEVNSTSTNANNLAVLIPYEFNSRKINEITIDGTRHAGSFKKIKGFNYAFLTLKPGAAHSVIVSYKN